MKYIGYLFIIMLTGCAPVSVEPDIAAMIHKPQNAKALAELQKQQQLQALLILAKEALNAGRLMVPAEDSAYRWYMQALNVDELNQEAHWGMRQITAQYMELAEQAFKVQRRDEAELMMVRAMQISATDRQRKALRARYPEQKPRDNEFVLSLADLDARNAAVLSQLKVIANKAHDQKSRLTIVARSDAEGRWIYQQMRNAVDGYRLRGNIVIGSHPKVVLIDLGSG